ncbi:hypothetical protein [Rhizobium esperanzae]|uniref:Sulfur carrier protein ThiS n=1 Tax=Rhizobium esperanzae TaxID=1967781 RepID=A0A7W6R592_9HYPH|nr:hypothetical protein [Rhizobium esperanzae]MBB4236663.1 sulfur carrier protein ThiS [Rhizobium esperanzae]
MRNEIVLAQPIAELIPPGEAVDVYFRSSPLRSHREHLQVPAGLSVSEIIALCGIKPGRLHVSIGPDAVYEKYWSRVRVKPGATVTIIKVPGKGALRAIAGLVVALVAAVAAPWLVGALLPGMAGTAAASVATGLIGAGIMSAGMLQVNPLLSHPGGSLSSLTDTRKRCFDQAHVLQIIKNNSFNDIVRAA